MYSVSWYGVGIRKESVTVDLLGSNSFKSCVVNARWSPHIPEECLVLLESGELYLFVLDSVGDERFKGRKLRVLWDFSTNSENDRWFSCGFSWHPRVLVVAHSVAVFLIDCRSGDEDLCNVRILLKIDKFCADYHRNDRFVAFSVAASDGFHFVVATDHLLLLCDLRKPFMPVLRWAHSLEKPSFINVFRLSELRSQMKDDEYEWASKTGYSILLGSFWNSEFSMFCYGPDTRRSKTCQTISEVVYAWELPSCLSLPAGDCDCGSCLFMEEFTKDDLPQWIDWRQKKDLVVGFGILEHGLYSKLSVSNLDQYSFGGFMLVRLTSSGKLQLQGYHASWKYVKPSKKENHGPSPYCENSLLYENAETDELVVGRKFFIKFKWLNEFLESTLGQTMMKILNGCSQENLSFWSDLDLHENFCQKLKASKFRSSSEVLDVFMDTSLPTSIYEIAKRCVWVQLPINFFRFDFSVELHHTLGIKNYGSVNGLEDHFKKPCRRRKRSRQQKHDKCLVGPDVPLPVLSTIHKIQTEETDTPSAKSEIDRQCDKVMQVANEVTTADAGSQLCSDHIVSLRDDKEDECYVSQNRKLFSSYQPTAFSDIFFTGSVLGDSVHKDKRHTTMVFKSHQKDKSDATTEMDVPQLFDSSCPLELTFQGPAIDIEPKELATFRELRARHLKFKEDFILYQEFLTRS